jgi:hypothetical protein
MSFRIIAPLVLACAFASSLVSTTGATAAAACTDYGYRAQARVGESQLSNSLDWINLDSYRAGEAWALRGYRTFYAQQPCNASYRRHRQDELNVATYVWNVAREMRRNDLTSAARDLRRAGHWLDVAAAEEATW